MSLAVEGPLDVVRQHTGGAAIHGGAATIAIDADFHENGCPFNPFGGQT